MAWPQLLSNKDSRLLTSRDKIGGKSYETFLHMNQFAFMLRSEECWLAPVQRRLPHKGYGSCLLTFEAPSGTLISCRWEKVGAAAEDYSKVVLHQNKHRVGIAGTFCWQQRDMARRSERWDAIQLLCKC